MGTWGTLLLGQSWHCRGAGYETHWDVPLHLVMRRSSRESLTFASLVCACVWGFPKAFGRTSFISNARSVPISSAMKMKDRSSKYSGSIPLHVRCSGESDVAAVFLLCFANSLDWLLVEGRWASSMFLSQRSGLVRDKVFAVVRGNILPVCRSGWERLSHVDAASLGFSLQVRWGR